VNVTDLQALIEQLPMSPELKQQLLSACLGARDARLHHYVPQAYQRAWAQGRTVLVWDTLEGRVFRASPRVMMAGADYFQAIGPDRKKHRMIEGLLSFVDGQYARLIGAIRSTGQLPRDEEERASLGYILALQAMRVAQRRRVYNDMADYLAKLVASPGLRETGLDPNDFIVEAHNNAHIGIMSDVATTVMPDWVAREWLLYTARHPVIVTSDNPVMYTDYEGDPVGMQTAASVFFPISPTQLLVLAADRNFGARELPASGAILKEAERRVIRTRDRWIIGHPEQLFFARRRGRTIPRRAQLKLECVSHEFDHQGRRISCLMRHQPTYANKPVIRTCDYFAGSPKRVTLERVPPPAS